MADKGTANSGPGIVGKAICNMENELLYSKKKNPIHADSCWNRCSEMELEIKHPHSQSFLTVLQSK